MGVVNATPRLLYLRERDSVPIVFETLWAPGPVWMGAKNLAPTGIRSPDRPCRSESLYRLSYFGLCCNMQEINIRHELNFIKCICSFMY